jgi:formylglycine-generating enzyme required for sulfatase activity
MHGNVWEWVEDRWQDNYEGAPDDGSAWVQGRNSGRVVRGGAWDYLPRYLRAAFRGRFEPGSRLNYLGFRVARTMIP